MRGGGVIPVYLYGVVQPDLLKIDPFLENTFFKTQPVGRLTDFQSTEF